MTALHSTGRVINLEGYELCHRTTSNPHKDTDVCEDTSFDLTPRNCVPMIIFLAYVGQHHDVCVVLHTDFI